MIYAFMACLLLVFVMLYSVYNSCSFQLFYRKHRMRKGFVEKFSKVVKGKYVAEGYFGPSHKIISSLEYESFSNRYKTNFSKCYNIVKFKSHDIDWELYFNLIKDGFAFVEIFNLRAFPHNYKIRSEGNVEKSYNKINIFTNNKYLTKVLEEKVFEELKTVIRHNGDFLLISGNNMHFKSSLNLKSISNKWIINVIKAIKKVKHEVYRKNVLEY